MPAVSLTRTGRAQTRRFRHWQRGILKRAATIVAKLANTLPTCQAATSGGSGVSCDWRLAPPNGPLLLSQSSSPDGTGMQMLPSVSIITVPFGAGIPMPETQTIHVRTLSFGELEVPESRILLFKEGIPGFPNHNRFVVLSFDNLRPFDYLQALDEPPVAFLVINPFLILPEYEVRLSESEMADLRCNDRQDLGVYAMTTIPDDPTKATVNLFAPVVINASERLARQLLLHESGYSVKHPLFKSGSGKVP